MRPDLPWNIAGIPPEAREAARAAARREGLSVGEWLTRRILAGLSDMSEASAHSWTGPDPQARAAASRRDSEEMLDRVSRSEAETSEVARRIEDQLRNMARRLDSAERTQSENNRVMSKAAVEMNIAAREQAQAFDQLGAHVIGLAERLDRVEKLSTSDATRDAIKALHQGLTRLADQIAQTANQSATQISALANNLESVAGRVSQARSEAENSNRTLESRIAVIDERVRTVEQAAKANAETLDRALETLNAHQNIRRNDHDDAIARLEETVMRLEARGSDPTIDRRLSGIERALSDIAGRIEQPDEEDQPSRPGVEDTLKRLAARIEAAEAAHRESVVELKKAIAAEKAQSAPPPAAAPADLPPPAAEMPPFTAAPVFDASASAPAGFEPPPFPDAPPPFAADAAPPPAFETADGFGTEQGFSAGTGFAAETFASGPTSTVDSYLSAARRSAQAAAQAEAERAGRGSFRWSGPASEDAAPNRTRTLLIAVLALVVIAVIAGVILSRRSGNVTHTAGIGALFTPKTPATPPPATKPSTAAAETAKPALTTAAAAPEPAPATKPMTPAPAKLAPAKPAPAKRAAEAHAAPKAPLSVTAQAPRPALVHQTAAIPAIDRLTQLANAGNARAETIVGLKYLDGDGVPVNDKDAAKWLGLAAQAGEPVAEYRLGTLYERGRGVPADIGQAVHWYEAAALKGNRKAMHNLAVAYAQGTGVKKDFTEAARWFTKAADLGLADSQFNLAVLYERGLGVPQSLLDAYKWYAVAAAQGDAESKTRLQAIAAQLSPEARAAAQQAAQSFTPGTLDARANVAPQLTELPRS